MDLSDLMSLDFPWKVLQEVSGSTDTFNTK